MLLLIDIGNLTLCNSLTDLKRYDIKYQEITDLKLARRTYLMKDCHNNSIYHRIKNTRPMADYVSGTDFLHSFEAGWGIKGYLRSHCPQKLGLRVMARRL